MKVKEQETNKQRKQHESTWIYNTLILLSEWQAVLLGMRCWHKDLTKSENEGFCWKGRLQRRKNKELEVLRSKPHSFPRKPAVNIYRIP